MKLVNVFVSVGVVAALVACGETETASTYIEKAKSFKVNEIDSKLIALKNAVKTEPKNGEARYFLGVTYLSQGFGVGAVKELEKAQDYKFDKNKVIPSLARAYILTSSHADLIDLDKQLNTLSEEAKVQYLAYKTLAAIRLENPELAQNSFDSAAKILPNNAYTFLSNAYLDMANNNLEEAKGHVEKTLTLLVDNPDALLLLGQINTAMGAHAQATENYLNYAKVQPKSNIVILFIAQSLLKEEKYLEAERYADIILNAAPNQPFAHYVKSTSQFELKNYQQAKEHAESALKAQFNQGPLKLIAGISSYFLNNYEQSYYHLEGIVKYLVPEHPARKMFAVSQLQLGMIDEISETLQDFNSTTKEDEKFLSSLSYQLAELGAIDNAKVLAKQAMSNTPENAEQNMREGILKLMLNDPSGINNLKEAVALKPDMLGAELALAYAAIQAKDYEQAEKIATKWKAQYPDKPGGYNVLAAVYLKKNERVKAKSELNKSLEISKQNIFALLELTNLAIVEGDVDEAKRISDIAVKELPSNINILKQHYSLNKNDAAFDKIKALYKSDESNLRYGILYAELLIEKKEFNEAVNVVDAYETTVKSPKKLWQLKVVSHNALKNVNKAQTVLEEWMKTNPYHVEPVVLLADFAAKKGDSRKALTIINRALESEHQNNRMLMLGKMQLLLDGKLAAEAKDYYDEIKKSGLSEIIGQGIEGKIALLEKDYGKASSLLSAFYEVNPSAKNVILLSTALVGNKQETEAIEFLEGHLQKNTRDNNVRMVLANIYIGNNPSKAISSYKTILNDYPENVMVLNNVAWLLMEQGNLEEALSYSESAYKVAGENINVVDTKAMILHKLGRTGEALRHLGAAHKLANGNNVAVAINYAEVLIESNRKQSALEILNLIKTNNQVELNRVNKLKNLAK